MAVIISFSFSSCQMTSQNIEKKFNDVNESLKDSISYYKTVNEKLFSECNFDKIKSGQKANFISFYRLIRMHNKNINEYRN